MTMQDKIEIIGSGSLIQHGKLNNRIYLMKLADADTSGIVKLLRDLAEKNEYSKIFCKVPKSAAPLFLSNGYILEASIPRFYNNREDVFFVSKFLNQNRFQIADREQFEKFSQLLKQGSPPMGNPTAPKTDYKIGNLTEEHTREITAIYKEVFVSYPFPIHDPAYILETMNEDVQYYGAQKHDQLAAVASSEMDKKGSNAEMTDFATQKNHLGNNLSVHILQSMEEAMKTQGIKTLYTIARLASIPMNKTFLKFNYNYSGTLINNTNIAGKIESMNVYYKHLI